MNKARGKTPAAQERYWTQIIKEARCCPHGVKAYCAQKNISVNNYYYWFGRLRVNHPEWENLGNHPGTSANGNGSSSDSEPETEVVERPVRRTFTAAYKYKILKEIDEASPGKVAAILRREGLYSSHVQIWRKEESRKVQEARKRGPKTNPLAAEVKRLRAENARLEKRLTKAGHLIELQKKMAEIMEVTLDEIQDDD
jgi:transposase-like protein